MQRPQTYRRVSEGELIKAGGFLLDFDEIARAGKMSKEESFIAKWYGIYDQRQAGNYMLRVVLPGGLLSSAEARALAAISERYALGLVAFTTRQAAQLHWLKLKALPDVQRALAAAGLSAFHGCGDVTRNVTACSIADVCPHQVFDVLPDVKRTARVLTSQRDLDDLPRKFKISFNGCSGQCALPYMNDIGAIAVRAPLNGTTVDGYRIVIGGGHGWQPFVAEPLFDFVPRAKIVDVCRAVALLYRDKGDRWNRATARLKYAVYRNGIAHCREAVERHLDAEGVDRRDIFTVLPVQETVPKGRFLAGDVLMGTDGLAVQQVRILKGEIRFDQLVRLAELSEAYGDKFLRANIRQNLEIHGVRPESLAELRREIERLSLGATGCSGLSDIVTCVGTTYCPLAVTRTHHMTDLLGFVQSSEFDDIRSRVVINITGCTNGCSPYRTADIGLRGARIRENLGSVEGYDIAIGGSQHKHGVSIGTYKQDDCARIVRVLLNRFRELALPEEAFCETVRRIGTHPFEDSVRGLGIHYELAEAPSEYSSPADGMLRPLDEATLNKDVPCRAACPASTRIPWYIEQIAKGNPDAAYRINQEDNVFPGVLGRICTRPCEKACRHNWTCTRGTVAICHLKRAAADSKPMRPAPLPAWFGPSHRRVAVIGSGPSGLTAARELRRYGHEVVLFERERELGGMMRLSIPHFRLPRPVLDEEITAIVDSGIEVRTGEDISWERLRELEQGFDAVLLAAGTISPSRLNIPGLPDTLGVGGLDLMRRYCLGEPLELRAPVRVIGGGFTAVDCARVARRVLGVGGGDISLLVRRTRDLMSVTDDEIAELEEEQIEVQTLVSPIAADVRDGKLRSLTIQRNVLGAPDRSGRPTALPLEGATFSLSAGTLVFAIGQSQHIDLSSAGVSMKSEVRTSRDKLFVAGDFSTGSLDVIHAVASGKKAAAAIDAFLIGHSRRRPALEVSQLVGGETGRLRDHDLAEKAAVVTLPLAKRHRQDEVEQGLTTEGAQTNAGRCYLCHYKYEIDQNKCIHCDLCVKAAPRDCIRRVSRLFVGATGEVNGYVETEQPKEATFIWIDSRNCIRCGACHRICPTGAIAATRADIRDVSCV